MPIQDAESGGGPAADWLSKVYQELRRKAQAYLNDERSGHTLNATALVHEAYIKLAAGTQPPDFEKTGHFYAAAAEAMRRILVDHARSRLAQKRGGEGRRQGGSALDNAAALSAEQSPEEILALDEALSRLAARGRSPARPGEVDFGRERGVTTRRIRKDIRRGGATKLPAERHEHGPRDFCHGLLGEQDAQAAEVVRLRFFAGLDIEQTAKVLGVSPRTVKRQWQFARAWLYRELES